ncbi:DNA alkylation repair enzyme [Burkholderiales bacterium JOSHI_001]|nr:DNA alkylation repair enzyme [Burkholderiales bacterium JOSHI_001]
MEPFKNLLNASVVAHAAAQLSRAAPDFDAKRFQRLATRGLDALEFKARADHIASALQACLPADFDQAATMLEAALAPPKPVDESGPTESHTDGLAGWILWPAGEFVARAGLQHPQRALAALHAFTQRFTAEFAIRPFIQAHPDLVIKTLARWATDPSPHVRRLVSEGSRPRLPWGLRLAALVKDPSPTLPLLAALQDDPSDYVRRSVANHLNDIAKDHPQVVVAWVRDHLGDAPPQRRALLRHASRSLVKQGHAETLALWGLGTPFKGEAAFTLAPKRLRVGEALQFSLKLRSTARKAQPLEIDYVLHHVKANGSTSPKVFKGWKLDLAADATRELAKRHSMKAVTTRRYHAGEHRVDIQINGKVVAGAAFQLVLA